MTVYAPSGRLEKRIGIIIVPNETQRRQYVGGPFPTRIVKFPSPLHHHSHRRNLILFFGPPQEPIYLDDQHLGFKRQPSKITHEHDRSSSQ